MRTPLTVATLCACLTASILLNGSEYRAAPAKPPETPYSVAERALQSVGADVTIIWTSGNLNCGALISPVGQGGCYRGDPGIIYLSEGMTSTVEYFIALHEYAHTLGLDECAADKFAIKHGADPAVAHYLPNC